MSKGWKKQLTPEAAGLRAKFEANECVYCRTNCNGEDCRHPGDPVAQEEDDSCWEWISPGRLKQIARWTKRPNRKARKNTKLMGRGTYRRGDVELLRFLHKMVERTANILTVCLGVPEGAYSAGCTVGDGED